MMPLRRTDDVARLGRPVPGNVKDVLDADGLEDTAKADGARQRDEEADELNTGLFREVLTYMMEDPRNTAACAHLLFAAKTIERIGDHASNIAERIHHLVEGEAMSVERPEGDEASFTAVEPPEDEADTQPPAAGAERHGGEA